MEQLILDFPDQLQEALQLGRQSGISLPDREVRHVYIAGLGGSGIGGDFTASVTRDVCPVPVHVGKQYAVPGFVNRHTCAIASSYSGNTEETLTACKSLYDAGAHVICLSSGGKLMQFAKEKDLDHILVPSGIPAPRACLGYSVVFQLSILYRLGLIPDVLLEDIKRSAVALRQQASQIREKAGHAAKFLIGKIPVIYSTERIAPVGLRFRQQLNENAKILAWHHLIPEMNHNELVGWHDHQPGLAVLFLRNKDDFPRNKVRMDISKDLVSRYTDTVIEVYSRGSSLIGKMFYLVHFADWVSYELARMRNVDIMAIDAIDLLKGKLSEMH